MLSNSEPLVEDEPPVSIEIRPPFEVEEKPAESTSSPPDPQLPEPTVK